MSCLSRSDEHASSQSATANDWQTLPHQEHNTIRYNTLKQTLPHFLSFFSFPWMLGLAIEMTYQYLSWATNTTGSLPAASQQTQNTTCAGDHQTLVTSTTVTGQAPSKLGRSLLCILLNLIFFVFIFSACNSVRRCSFFFFGLHPRLLWFCPKRKGHQRPSTTGTIDNKSLEQARLGKRRTAQIQAPRTAGHLAGTPCRARLSLRCLVRPCSPACTCLCSWAVPYPRRCFARRSPAMASI